MHLYNLILFMSNHISNKPNSNIETLLTSLMNVSDSSDDERELLINTRQRRSNAGNKLQKLLEQELEDLKTRTQALDEDEIDLLFKEDEEDEDFKSEEDGDSEIDQEDQEDVENEKEAEDELANADSDTTSKSERAIDDDDVMLSESSSEDVESDEDEDAGEKELIRQERIRKKKSQKQKRKPQVIKRKLTDGDEKGVLKKKKSSSDSINAETLLLDTRRTSTRASVVQNKIRVYEKLSQAEEKRKLIRERLKRTREKEAVKELTQDDRMRIALETEQFNLLSLNKYKEQEVSKKNYRLAMQQRQKMKFKPGELIISELSTQWEVTPSMEIEDAQYWQAILDKRNKKRKKYSKKSKKKIETDMNSSGDSKNTDIVKNPDGNILEQGPKSDVEDIEKKDETLEKTDTEISQHVQENSSVTEQSQNQNRTENLKIESSSSNAVIKSEETCNQKEIENKFTSSEEIVTVNNLQDKDNREKITDDTPNIKTENNVQTIDVPEIENPVNSDEKSSTDIVQSEAIAEINEKSDIDNSNLELSAGNENVDQRKSPNDKEDVDITNIKRDDEQHKNNVSNSDNIREDIKSEVKKPEEIKNVRFESTPEISVYDKESSITDTNLAEDSTSVSDTTITSLKPEDTKPEDLEPEPINEGPNQLVAKNFVTAYYVFQDSIKENMNEILFGVDWTGQHRSVDVERIFSSKLPESDATVESTTQVKPDLSILDKFPAFGEFDKKIVQEVDDNTVKDLEIKIKTAVPTGIFLPSGMRKKCLINNRDCHYFDPKNGVPYSDVEAYKIIQELQSFNADNTSPHSYKWYGFSNGGIYLDSTEKPAVGVPEGF